MMYLIHKSTIEHPDGTFEIELLVVKKDKINKYTYTLASEYATRKFHQLYRRRETHGKALALLNKFKIKGE